MVSTIFITGSVVKIFQTNLIESVCFGYVLSSKICFQKKKEEKKRPAFGKQSKTEILIAFFPSSFCAQMSQS